MEAPKTLQQAILFFSDADNCIAYMVEARWPDGVVICPTCGRAGASWLANQKKWQCKTKHSKRQFSAKVGTIFEDSPLGLDKWLMASWMLANCKNGVSSYEIGRAIGVTQKSAWFMMHRIRLAMRDGEPEKIGSVEGGEVEVDETFIGGKPASPSAIYAAPTFASSRSTWTVISQSKRSDSTTAKAGTTRDASTSPQPELPANVSPTQS